MGFLLDNERTRIAGVIQKQNITLARESSKTISLVEQSREAEKEQGERSGGI